MPRSQFKRILLSLFLNWKKTYLQHFLLMVTDTMLPGQSAWVLSQLSTCYLYRKIVIVFYIQAIALLRCAVDSRLFRWSRSLCSFFAWCYSCYYSVHLENVWAALAEDEEEEEIVLVCSTSSTTTISKSKISDNVWSSVVAGFLFSTSRIQVSKACRRPLAARLRYHRVF